MTKQNKTADRYNSIFSAILLLILAGLLAWLSIRYPLVTDWTRQGRHSLSEASIQLLNNMEGQIEISAYAREQPELRQLIRTFVSRYQRIKEDISLQFINPDTVPDQARNLGINVNGELIVRYKNRSEHVRSDSEQEFTNALQRLLRGTEHWLAFIEGHGERSPLDTGNHDISTWVRHLQNRGLNLQPINLARFNTIPDNTTVLVIANPQVAYLPGEVTAILDYLTTGGNLLWLIDPQEKNGLQKLQDYLGLDIPAGTIIDIAGQVIGIDDPTISLITKQLYGPHPAVDQFELTTLFPMATAINYNASGPWQITPVITTAKHTWLERGELKGDVGFDEDQDILGPFNLAISLERDLQRILIIGDGDFVSNTYIDNSGNLELGLRIIDWLVRDDSFISIPARTVEDADLQLTQLTSIIMGFGFLVFLPLSLLAMGGLIWWRRNNL